MSRSEVLVGVGSVVVVVTGEVAALAADAGDGYELIEFAGGDGLWMEAEAEGDREGITMGWLCCAGTEGEAVG